MTWLTTRRAASGKIGTSEAAILWEQAQAMRAELVTQRDKAAEQRDRLIESQAATVLPSLASISDGLGQIVDSNRRIIASLDELAALARAEAGTGTGGAAARD